VELLLEKIVCLERRLAVLSVSLSLSLSLSLFPFRVHTHSRT